jgi:multidrug resistance protein, MATE family
MNQIMINGIGSWQGLGFIGGPLASSITWIIHPILLWIYVIWRGIHKQTLANGCEKEAISPRRLWDFLKIGVPSSMMIVLEVIGFEIITLLIGGMRNDVATSAHSVIYSLTAVVWVISSGFGNGAATRVGNLLGEQKADRARHFATFASYTLGAVQFIVSIILILLRYVVPRVYSSVPAVVELAGELMPIGVVFTFFDGLATIGTLINTIFSMFHNHRFQFLRFD